MSTLAKAHAVAAQLSQGAKASYLFDISGSKCNLSVVSFNAKEQISSPFEVNVTVATQDEVILEDLLDLEGVLTISIGLSKRYFHGVIKECTCIGDNGGYSIFHICLVPSLWLLSLEQDCRIFQGMNAQDIVLKILDESGIKGSRIRLALKDKERNREYCVQYRETDLNFISRILEDEGIFYFFEHYADKHVIVFADDPTAYLPIQGKTEVKFNVDGGNVATEESVTSFIYSRRLHPGKVTQRDFNYQRINLDLSSEKQTKKPSDREVYDYPGNYFKQKKGDLVTQIHKERIQVLRETAEGQSSCPRLMPGCKWELTNNDFADKYLTVGVNHGGSQPQALGEHAGSGGFSYHNSFIVIPADATYRPQIIADKPAITGVQTATVTGPKGEEIHTDKLGRVTVQFHWDRHGMRDAKSSCWIRVAQSWGGLSRGAQYIPRIGDEVLVEFAEGDPDRPIITGSVYNGDNLPINNLDKSKTQSGFRTKTHKGEGFNELRFDDATGAQEVYIHGEKDFKVTIKNNETKTIGNNLVNQVGKTATITAGKQLQLICGSASIVLDQSGKIVIHGTEVFVSGNTLHLDGKPIQMNMGGAAGIAATLIPVEAVAGAAGGKAATSTKAETSKKKPEHKKVTKEDMKNADNKVTQTYGKDIPENKRTPSAFDRSALEDNKTFHENGGGEENAYYHPLWNKIHINSDKANIGTPIHEDLHYYSSKKFGESFGSDLDEGTTEYFTRKLATNDRVGIYEDQYRQSAKIANGVGEQTLKDAYFKGDEKAISAIKKFMAPKTFDNYPVHLKELQPSYGI